MSTYSHRDHRVFRASYRLVGAVAGLAVALVVIAALAPGPIVGAAAVLALALLGGFALVRSSAIVEGYVGDLRRAGAGSDASGWLRVEVESRIELERSVFVVGRASPNVRRPAPAPSRDLVPMGRIRETS